MIRFFTIILFCILEVNAGASIVQIDGIYYNLNDNGKDAAVTSRSDGKRYSGDVVIPSSVSYNGHSYSVTSIGGGAFQYCRDLTSVTIPNSVKSIGFYAFSYCSGLTSVTIPNSVTNIYDFAFEDCTDLTTVTIPNSITSINQYVFRNCSSLASVVIPSTVTTIGTQAFADCRNLTSITIPNRVASIGTAAFACCSGLTSIIIPNSVKSIGIQAFYYCSGLTTITIPNSVKSIGNMVFNGCSSLTSISVSSENTNYDSRDNCNAIIETSSNTLIAGCSNTIIPNTVTTIGSSAFGECSGLTSIIIPNSVKSIGDEAFYYCSGLTSITVSSENSNYDSRNNCNAIIETSSNTLIAGCKNTNIPNGVASIGEAAFGGCSGLMSITIPNTVTVIGHRAFQYCRNLTSITIPNSVASIGEGAFSGCSGLAAIVWNPNVAFTGSVSNPNLLLYVKSSSYAPKTVNNVIVNNVAAKITLTEAESGNDFYCPQAFTARSITYTHSYQMTTGIDKCQGWETIALPFDVQTIRHETKGVIVPFAAQTNSSQKAFWLYELTNNGWRAASAIKANTPYIISMPNNDLYFDEVRLNGRVTFSATDVTVPATTPQTALYRNRTFIPNYKHQNKNESIFTLNVNNEWYGNNTYGLDGSMFVVNQRCVSPFEAYMQAGANSARNSFGIFEDMTTEIRGVEEMVDARRVSIYNMSGQKRKTAGNESIDELKRKLPAGVYIINGQKVIVR